MTEAATSVAGRMRLGLWLAAALLCLAAFAQQFVGIGFTKRITIDPDAMKPDQGHAWRVRIPDKHRSPLALYKIRVLEDGEHKGELVKSNRLVRNHGTGRYRLAENGILRFSASDNSSPEFNGKRYAAEVPASVSPLGLGATVAVLLGAGFLARRHPGLSPRKAPPAWLLALVVFGAALGLRLWALGAYADYSDGGFAVRGSPYSDALAWTDLALNLRDGYGFEGPFAGQRPFYPVFMANVYRLFGDSLAAGKMVNVFTGALSVLFVFLLVLDATRKWSLGLVAACVLMWSREQLVDVQLLVTESMGLTLILAGAYAWWAGLVRLNPWILLAAGLLIGLSNLTRTYTMLGLPLFAVITLGTGLFQRSGWRRAMLLAAMFALGATIAMAPWMIRQKVRYGTFSLSTSGADLLYSAALDQPGWNRSVFEELDAAGLQRSQLKEANAFFSRRYKEEVAKDRGRYIGRLAGWFGACLNHYDFKSPHARLIVLLAGFATGVAAVWGGRPLAGAVFLAGCCLLVTLIGSFAPAAIFLGAAAIGLWLGDRRLRLTVIVLLATLAGGAMMSAMIGNFGLNRTAPLTAWVLPCLLLTGLAAALGRIIGKRAAAPARDSGTDGLGADRVWNGLPGAACLAIIGLAVISVLAAAATGFSREGEGESGHPGLTEAEQGGVRDWIRKELPATKSAPDSALFVSLAKLTPYQVPLRADEDTSHWARPFLPRPYERTEAHVRVFDGSRPRGILRATQFKGILNEPAGDAYHVLAGVLSVDPNAPLGHDTEMVEALALVPFEESGRTIQFDKATRFPITPEAAAILTAEPAEREK